MTRRRTLSLSLAALVLLLGGGIYWLLATESGLRFLWARAQGVSPVPFAGDVHGKLIGPLRADGLVIELRHARVEATSAELDWQPRALLEGRLRFTHAAVRDLIVTVKARAPQANPAPPTIPAPRMPLEVRGKVEGLIVRWPSNLADGKSPVRQVKFERVDLDAVAGPRRMKVSALSLDGYGAHLETHGDLELRLDGPVQLETRWSYRPAQGETIRGHGVVRGTLSRPVTDQSLDDVLRGTAKGSLVWLDKPVRWEADLRTAKVNISRLHRPARPVEIEGRLHGEGGGERLAWSASGALRDPLWVAWNFRFDAQRAPQGWRVPALVLSQPNGAKVTASGWLHTTGAKSVELDVAWNALALPQQKGSAAPWSTPKGRVTVQGALDSYRIAGEASLSRPGLPDGSVALQGTGDRNGIEIGQLRVAWLDGELIGSGQLQWQPFLEWRAELRARDINPARFHAAWPGRITAQVVTRGRRRDGKLQAEMALNDLGGTLREQPLAGGASATLDGDVVHVERFAIEAGTARFMAEGDAGARWDLRWSLDAARVEELLPGFSGTVHAKGETSGVHLQPHLRAEAQGEKLTWRGRKVARLGLFADLDLSGKTPWDLRIDADDLVVGEKLAFERIVLSGEGGPADHRLALDARSEGRAAHLEASGRYVDQRWQGTLAVGRFEDPITGIWNQTTPMPFTLTARDLRLGKSCWNREAAEICAALEGGLGREWQGQAELRTVPVMILESFFKRGFQVSGFLDGRAAFGYREGLTALDLDLAAHDGAFYFSLSDGEALTTAYSRVALKAQGSAQGMNGNAELLLVNGDRARAEFSLPRWRPGDVIDKSQTLRGVAEASMGELVWISLLAPDLVATGRVESRFSVSGTLGHPLVQGDASLAGGELAVPLLGISLADVRVATRVEADGSMTLGASARSGPGQLHASGRAIAVPEGWAFTMNVSGKDVEVARLPQANIIASPELSMDLRGRDIRLFGSVLVPKARIDLPEITAPVQASPDVVVVDQPETTKRTRRWNLISEVKMRFGDDVKLSGYGFSGRLGGEILVVEPPGGGAVGRGELEILDGKYTAYGQDLTIEEGRLLYGNAPLNNPGIQFLATREVESVKVGVTAAGRLKKPEVRLYSDPYMDDSQVLAYLVLGRPLETATKEETDVLQRAAVSLGLVGGTEVARQLASEAGLDVVNVQAGTQSQSTVTRTQTQTSSQSYQASIVLGKYLSPRLYVQYAVGLWDTGNAWQLRYLLDKNWTLKGESGIQSGVDLLYTIEK